MTNGIWQSLELELVNINVYAKFYQNIPYGWLRTDTSSQTDNKVLSKLTTDTDTQTDHEQVSKN